MKKINSTLEHIAGLSNREIIDAFAEWRWGARRLQACPKCGLIADHKWWQAKEVWCCRFCAAEFSVTSGMPFSNHRIPLRTILMGIVMFVNSAHSISAAELMRNLGISQKAACLLRAKIREALLAARPAAVDVMYVRGIPFRLDACTQSGAEVIQEQITIRKVTRRRLTLK